MNLNKLSLVVLSAGTVFMAASCNKTQTLTLEKATKWVEQHCPKEKTPAEPKSGLISYDYSATKGDEMRKIIKDAIGLEENLKKSDEIEGEDLKFYNYLSLDLFKGMYTEESIKQYDIVFTLSEGSFIITSNNPEDSDILPYVTFAGVEGFTKQTYNSKGRPTKTVSSLKKGTIDGNTGTAKGSATLTFKY